MVEVHVAKPLHWPLKALAVQDVVGLNLNSVLAQNLLKARFVCIVFNLCIRIVGVLGVLLNKWVQEEHYVSAPHHELVYLVKFSLAEFFFWTVNHYAGNIGRNVLCGKVQFLQSVSVPQKRGKISRTVLGVIHIQAAVASYVGNCLRLGNKAFQSAAYVFFKLLKPLHRVKDNARHYLHGNHLKGNYAERLALLQNKSKGCKGFRAVFVFCAYHLNSVAFAQRKAFIPGRIY